MESIADTFSTSAPADCGELSFPRTAVAHRHAHGTSSGLHHALHDSLYVLIPPDLLQAGELEVLDMLRPKEQSAKRVKRLVESEYDHRRTHAGPGGDGAAGVPAADAAPVAEASPTDVGAAGSAGAPGLPFAADEAPARGCASTCGASASTCGGLQLLLLQLPGLFVCLLARLLLHHIAQVLQVHDSLEGD